MYKPDARIKISLMQRAFVPKLAATDAKLVEDLAKRWRLAGVFQGYFYPG